MNVYERWSRYRLVRDGRDGSTTRPASRLERLHPWDRAGPDDEWGCRIRLGAGDRHQTQILLDAIDRGLVTHEHLANSCEGLHYREVTRVFETWARRYRVPSLRIQPSDAYDYPSYRYADVRCRQSELPTRVEVEERRQREERERWQQEVNAWYVNARILPGPLAFPVDLDFWITDRSFSAEAEKRAFEKLERHLTDEQQRSLKESACFRVETIYHGRVRRFRVAKSVAQNVVELSGTQAVLKYCAGPPDVPLGDVLLTQLLYLQHPRGIDEFETIANIWDATNFELLSRSGETFNVGVRDRRLGWM